MNLNSQNCNVAIIGAGPYGLSAAAYLRAAGVEARVFGEPMSFWEKRMPAGMCLRSNWGASHIADPGQKLTLDAYSQQNGNHISRPIPLAQFVDYGHWYQQQAVPSLERCQVLDVASTPSGFKVTLEDGEQFTSCRIVVAAGISNFANRPKEFEGVPGELASHSSEHNDLSRFRGRRVVVIGTGQSALESAALLKEAGVQVEVIGRQRTLNWVGMHPKLHRLGLLSSVLYSRRDVGPAGISRLVALPYTFRRFPRRFQDRMAYRAIRPAGAAWLQSRVKEIPMTLGRSVVSVLCVGNQLRLTLDNGKDRLTDHALLATGYRVDISRYRFLNQSLSKQLKTVDGFPVLGAGLESSIPRMYFLGKPAAWSFGPLLGFVSGAEFASNQLVRSIVRDTRTR
jgi:pyridine nucleotide-disulfide oxidoreductase